MPLQGATELDRQVSEEAVPVRTMPKKTKANQPTLQASSLAGLANLGPKSAQFLHHAGITSQEQLEQLGSVKAYLMVKQVEPSASLNLLWALEGAISGLHWREVAREHRTSLLLALETHQPCKQGESGS